MIAKGTRHSAVNNFVSDIRISHIGKKLFVGIKIELALEICAQEFNELYGKSACQNILSKQQKNIVM